jgi:hypothetical protein
MTLSLTPLPANVGAHTRLPNTDPSTGIVTFTARPTRHAWGITQTILAALGARDDVFGAGRRHDQDLTLLPAWLHAYQTNTIAVRHANHLTDKTLLDNLLHIAEAVGADLALTCDEHETRLVDWVEQHGGRVDTNEERLLRRLAKAARPLGPSGPPLTPPGFPQFLPRIDFYGFRARCRDILTPDQFNLVDRLYTSTFQAVQADPYATVQEASTRLAATVAAHRSPGEVLTVTRAAQAAMFTHGLLLKVDIDTLLNTVRSNRHRRFTPAEVRELRAYRTPWRSAAAVLRDADLSLDEIRALTLRQVDPDGTITTFPHLLPLHADATIYLQAQRRYRLSLGASLDEPLIENVAPHIKRALRLTGSELGLPAPGAHERNIERNSDRLQSALGVSLLPLVGLRLPSPTDIKKAA